MTANLGKMLGGLNPEDLPKFDITTYKALVAQRLLIGVCIVCGVAFIVVLTLGNDEMAQFILEAFLYFFGVAVLGVNAGQYAAQRYSSRELQEAKARGVETARLAGNGHITKDRPAVHIDQADVVEVPITERPRKPTGDARTDDESGS